jgi:tellurite resistance protein TerA
MQIRNKIVLADKGQSASIDATNLHAGSKGSLTSAPYIQLDKDAGVGDRGGDNQENMRFADLSHYNHILIVANIFAKSDAVFAQYDGNVSVFFSDQHVEVPLTSKDRGNNCVIAHIDNTGVAPKLINANRTLTSLPTVAGYLRGEGQSPGPSNGGGGFFGRLFGG